MRQRNAVWTVTVACKTSASYLPSLLIISKNGCDLTDQDIANVELPEIMRVLPGNHLYFESCYVSMFIPKSKTNIYRNCNTELNACMGQDICSVKNAKFVYM